jgi:hypothetical protein
VAKLGKIYDELYGSLTKACDAIEQGREVKDSYVSFFRDFEQKVSKYDSAIRDLDSLRKLRKDELFLEDNELIARISSHFRLLFFLMSTSKEHKTETLLDEGRKFLSDIEDFIAMWQTSPIYPFILRKDIPNFEPSTKAFIEAMLKRLGHYEVIEVFPWTTGNEISDKLRSIKEKIGRWDLKFAKFSEDAVILHLKDKGDHSFPEIADWINDLHNEEIQRLMQERRSKLKAQSKTEAEIERILEQEFPPDDKGIMDDDKADKRYRSLGRDRDRIWEMFDIEIGEPRI